MHCGSMSRSVCVPLTVVSFRGNGVLCTSAFVESSASLLSTMEPEPTNGAEGVSPADGTPGDDEEVVIFPEGQCIACQQVFGENDQAIARCKQVNKIHNFRRTNTDAHLQELPM